MTSIQHKVFRSFRQIKYLYLLFIDNEKLPTNHCIRREKQREKWHKQAILFTDTGINAKKKNKVGDYRPAERMSVCPIRWLSSGTLRFAVP
jgi:hypothetical protein